MDLNGLLTRAVAVGASDVHLKLGQPPVVRKDGELGVLDGWPALTDADLEGVLEIVGARSPERLQLFRDAGDLDIAYQDGDLPRFRVNAYRQRGAISFAFRVIPKTVPSFEQLSLPVGVQKLAEEHRGLILVTGATGSGKTTTLAAMIDFIDDGIERLAFLDTVNIVNEFFAEQVAVLVEEQRRFLVEAFRMQAKHLGRGRGQRAIDVDRQARSVPALMS